MAIRYLKMALLIMIASQALIYGIQNIANHTEAYNSIAYVMSNQDHVGYPNSAFPSITSPVLVWFALICVLIGEFGAGFLGFWGARELWIKRNASSDEFNQAKTCAVLSCGIAVATWLGLFMVIGGAYFQMWQTAAGDASLRGAYFFFASSAFVMIFINMKD